MSKTLLMICPSANRPNRLEQMLHSYVKYTNRDNTTLVVYIAENDPQIKSYNSLMQKYKDTPNIEWYISIKLFTAQIYNLMSTSFTQFDYYGVINDDHIVHTPDWNLALVDKVEKIGGWGIAHANDLWPSSSIDCDHPSCFVMSANIIRELGYMVLPALHHFGIDDYLRDICKPINCLVFCPSIIVEHMHAHCGKAPDDVNYRWVYSKEEMTYGARQYFLWTNYYKSMTLNLLIQRKERCQNEKC